MKYALFIIQLIPSIIDIIKKVEEIAPIPGVGGQKLALVKEMLGEAYAGITEAWPTIEKIVNAIVTFANTVGAFKKTE